MSTTPHTSSNSRLAATAHHEAGHAVAAWLRGVRFRYVTIEDGEDSFGHVRYLGSARGMAQTHARGVVALAGEAAQRRFNPRSIRRHHGESDRQTVIRFAIDYTGSTAEADALIRLWQAQAKELVASKWDAIEHVALVLLKRKILKLNEVTEVITEWLRTRPRPKWTE
jgi:hypothetical protein